jgi:hypothetical protein
MITIDLDEIRTRAEAVAQIRLNRSTTPEDELRATLYTLERASDECRLAELVLTVEQQRADLAMAEAGQEAASGSGEDGAFGRHMVTFRHYVETFTRRIAAIERVLEARADAQP